jgi:hypothetical protein
MTALDAWTLIEKYQDNDNKWFSERLDITEQQAGNLIIIWALGDHSRFEGVWKAMKS